MGIVGRTGIVAQDYEQVAAIRPHVSNLAPVAGAFLAGPAVGITTLLVTQIFRKPLSSVGENYYTISGSFEDPVFTQVSQDELDTQSFAECAAELPSLSPEEIRAIEELMLALTGRYTFVIVTHNMAQASRVSEECIFMLLGELIEHRRTQDLFLAPQDSRTADYIEGRYG